MCISCMRSESFNAPFLTAVRCFAWRSCLAANLLVASFSIFSSWQVLLHILSGGPSGNATLFWKQILEACEKWLCGPMFPFFMFYDLTRVCVCKCVCVCEAFERPKASPWTASLTASPLIRSVCQLHLCSIWTKLDVKCMCGKKKKSKTKIHLNVAWNISVIKIKAKKKKHVRDSRIVFEHQLL